ncbi:MAG: PASTA domain-containing protein [Thermodesulfobacteriota bacterium]
MKKSRFTYVLAAALAVCMLAGQAAAGPLDRRSMEPRRNPAADDMIRIPGVVGMDYRDAMAYLQEAGLNPQLERIKKVDKRYEGREGQVVRQMPLPAGVAMLGSSVTVTYYLPEDSAGEGYGDDRDFGDDGYEDRGYGDQGYGDEEYGGPGNGGEGYKGEDYGDEPVQGGGPAWGAPVEGGWIPPRNPLPSPAAGTPASGITPGGGPDTGDTPAPAGAIRGKIREKARSLPNGRDLQEAAGKGKKAGGPKPAGAPSVKPVATPVGRAAAGASGLKVPTPGQVGRALGAKEKATGAGAPSVRPVPSLPSAGESGKAPVIEAVPVTPALTLQGSGGSTAPEGSTGGNTGTAPTFRATPVNPALTMQGGTTPGVSDDGSCRSWTAIASDIYKEADRVAQELKCAAVPGERLWKSCIKNARGGAFGQRWIQTVIKRWNRLVKKTSWATIGPRQLTFGKTHKGRLISTGGRVFITPLPVDKGSVTLTLTKKAGKARTSVTACTFTDGGDRVKVWDFVIPKGKKNRGQTWTKTLNGVEDRLISIHLDSKSGEHTFKYELKATRR